MSADTECKPGRPKGSSRYRESDPILLQMVADKVLANPGLSTRAAILQILGKQDDAALRRLQGKLPPREQFVAKARDRAEAAERRRVEMADSLKATAMHIGYAVLHVNRAVQVAAEYFARSPEFQVGVEVVRQFVASGATERAVEMATRFSHHPIVKQMVEFQEQMQLPENLRRMEEMQRVIGNTNRFIQQSRLR